MKKTLLFLSMLSLLLVVACRNDILPPQKNPVTKPPQQKIVFRTGTSFGECFGYCLTEMTVDSTAVHLTRLPWGRGIDSSHPLLNYDTTIAIADWNRIRGAFDKSAFDGLDTVIGCPDCADGGAEWLEVEQGTYKRRVTMEYGAKIPAIDGVMTELRAIRVRFPRP